LEEHDKAPLEEERIVKRVPKRKKKRDSFLTLMKMTKI
jgi:hypothetical protein